MQVPYGQTRKSKRKMSQKSCLPVIMSKIHRKKCNKITRDAYSEERGMNNREATESSRGKTQPGGDTCLGYRSPDERARADRS